MSGDGALAWRPIGPGDAADWAGLLNTISAADRDWEYVSEQDLLEDFSDPYLDFARGSVAVYHQGTMAGCGLLECRTSAEPVHEMRYHGGVHPAYRGQGLGGRLLGWAETAALPLHQERYPGRPLSMSGSCLAHNAAAVALYAAHGYRPSRWFHAMTRDLSAALPEAPVPSGVDVVGLTPDRWAPRSPTRSRCWRWSRGGPLPAATKLGAWPIPRRFSRRGCGWRSPPRSARNMPTPTLSSGHPRSPTTRPTWPCRWPSGSGGRPAMWRPR